MNPTRRKAFPLTRGAVASAAAACVWLGHAAPAAAIETVTGSAFTQPGLGGGSTQLWVGSGYGSSGDYTLDAGSQATYGGLYLAWMRAISHGVIDGAGTQLSLDNAGQRLMVGHWGTAILDVSGGARILADGNANGACAGLCTLNIGAFTGTLGTLSLRDAGTLVSVRDAANLANAGVDTVNGFGTLGGHTSAQVFIDSGARLITGGINGGRNTTAELGTSDAQIAIAGAGSAWVVVPNSNLNAASRGPVVALGGNGTNTSRLGIYSGGLMQLQGTGNVFSSFIAGTNGGSATVVIEGAESRLEFLGESSALQLGRNSASSGRMLVANGGSVRGLYYMAVGRDGGQGNLLVTGNNALIDLSGTATAAANGTANVAGLDIGRGIGTVPTSGGAPLPASGQVAVTAGGRIAITATQARSNGSFLNIGRDGGTGSLSIDGAGSTVLVSAASVLPGGGAGEAFNPAVRVGRLGTGNLSISNGGQLLLQGDAVSVPGATRSTSLIIGGVGETNSGGTGTATVSGQGSRIVVAGSDPFIGVGIGAGSVGTLSVQDKGSVSGLSVSVGRSSGVGMAAFDNATLTLTGQQTGTPTTGANLSVGLGGGTGVLNLSNNARVQIANTGTANTGMNIGGAGTFSGGSGLVTMSGGASIAVAGTTVNSGVNVGRDGTGTLRMSASSLSVTGNGGVSIGRHAGGVGTLVMTDASTLTAPWVGVARSRDDAGVATNGGQGTLIVNSGSTVTAGRIEVGSNGYLGGNGTLVGDVVNMGVINPGNSPGTLHIDGSFVNATGGRIVLEVQDDGAGGYITDHLIFGAGTAVDLGSTQVTFSFLGDTNPAAYQQAVGLDIANFMVQATAGGGSAPLATSAFANVSFGAQAQQYAISDFSYVAGGTASFTVTAVPEPSTWAALMAGLGVLGWRLRRSGRA